MFSFLVYCIRILPVGFVVSFVLSAFAPNRTRFVSKPLEKISKRLITVAHMHGMMMKYCRALRWPTVWPCSASEMLRPEFPPAWKYYIGHIELKKVYTSSTIQLLGFDLFHPLFPAFKRFTGTCDVVHTEKLDYCWLERTVWCVK